MKELLPILVRSSKTSYNFGLSYVNETKQKRTTIKHKFKAAYMSINWSGQYSLELFRSIHFDMTKLHQNKKYSPLN